MNKDDKYNKENPAWGFRPNPHQREDMKSMLESFGSKQAVLSYLVDLGLKEHSRKLQEQNHV